MSTRIKIILIAWIVFICFGGVAIAKEKFSILIKLPVDRQNSGTLELTSVGGLTIVGPFWVLGKGDNANATAKGNPDRIRTKEGGDFPYGSYQILELSPKGARPERSFGKNGVFILKAIGGEAELAEKNGRKNLRIHGGELKDGKYLRPTEGCLRVRDSDFMQLISAIQSQGIQYPLEVNVIVGTPIGVPDLFCAPNE